MQPIIAWQREAVRDDESCEMETIRLNICLDRLRRSRAVYADRCRAQFQAISAVASDYLFIRTFNISLHLFISFNIRSLCSRCAKYISSRTAAELTEDFLSSSTSV
jgi:hypothetical protein